MKDTQTRTIDGWIVTMIEIFTGYYSFIASSGTQWRTSMLRADSIDQAFDKITSELK